MDSQRLFVVVLGQDRKGIVARVSSLLFEHNINILDIEQKVMDGTFVMVLLADRGESPLQPATLRLLLEELAEEMGLKVMLHSEAVIKAMHRV